MEMSLKHKSIINICQQINTLEGATAELGVFEGNTSILIAQNNNNSTHFAIDTFTGIQNAGVHDTKINGYFSNPSNTKLDRLNQYKNVVVVKGFFPYCLTEDMIKKRYKLVHFDGDTYDSCIDFIMFFKERMLENGVMIFDDYKSVHCPGVTKAMHEKFKNITMPTKGQGVILCRKS